MGERIRAKRVEARLSLRKLAVNAKISTGFLCDVEHDKRGCSVAVASRIADALKVDVGWLIGTSPARRRVQLEVIEFHSPRLNPGLIERFYAVTKDLREAACIVDLWLVDIAAVLKEFGYEMEIYTSRSSAIKDGRVTVDEIGGAAATRCGADETCGPAIDTEAL